MHMADALISPLVGGTMLAASASVAAYSARKIQKGLDDAKIPLMGVMGAFVFAAQMINFAIPGTGSSGHIGGGLLLAVLLGPQAGFLTMASVLLIQALFFGDGGLLALGCNIFNLGFFTCFAAYPLLFRPITRKGLTSRRIFTGALLASVFGLQLGSLGVVLQTLVSGRTALPAGGFLFLMQGIHLAIGIVEGLVTAAIVTFVWKARPEIVAWPDATQPLGKASLRPVLAAFLATIVLTGGALSWFASANPDGLEWSLEQAAAPASTATTPGGSEAIAAEPDGIHKALAWIQEKTALFPAYGFRKGRDADAGRGSGAPASGAAAQGESALASERAGTSASGLVGGAFTLLAVIAIGWLAGLARRRKSKAEA